MGTRLITERGKHTAGLAAWNGGAFWVWSRSSWTDCEEFSVTKVETDFIYFCEENARDLPMHPCHHETRRWYAVAKVFCTKKKIAYYFQMLLLWIYIYFIYFIYIKNSSDQQYSSKCYSSYPTTMLLFYYRLVWKPVSATEKKYIKMKLRLFISELWDINFHRPNRLP